MHFRTSSEYISFSFHKKKIEVYYFEEIGNIPPCYLCHQIEEKIIRHYDTIYAHWK